MKNYYMHCNQETNPEVSEDGVNWQTVSVKELEKILKSMKGKKDICVVYNRENPTGDPTPYAMSIFKIITDARLPIKLVKKKGSDGTGETEPIGEPSYTNCLLTLLARSPTKVVTLKTGEVVANLESLATNNDDMRWTKGFPFNYPNLSSDIIIKFILGIKPSKQIPHLYGDNREVICKLIVSEGKTETVIFKIELIQIEKGIQQVTVSRKLN